MTETPATMSDQSDLEEAIRLLRVWSSRHYAPYVEAETRDFLARHPEKPKLLPCPFCGGDGHVRTESFRWVVCEECGAMAGGMSNEVDAAVAWNRRATPASGPLSGGEPE